MLRLTAARTLSLLSLSLVSCRERLQPAECERLVERYAELLIRSDREETTAAELERLKAAARVRARQEPAFGECSSKVSRRAFECAMTAENVDRMEQCLL